MKKLICTLLALVMIIAMTACADENKDAYEAAVAAYNAGDYAAAAEQLYALGDYEDAAQLFATIQAVKTTSVKELTFPGSPVTTVTTEFVIRDGNLIKETITMEDGSVAKNYYSYNDDGLCTSQTSKDSDGGKLVFTHLYDDGIRTRTIVTNPDQSKDTYTYTCDEDGKILADVFTLSNGTVIETKHTYNEQGLLIQSDSTFSKIVYTYNHFGDVIHSVTTADGENICEISYTYTYDYSII